MTNLARIKIFSEKVGVYFRSTYCPTALYMQNMKKMIRPEIKKIMKNYLRKFICPRQPGKWKKGQRDKFGKILFYKRSFVNSFYLIHFCCGLVSHHHTKFKLKFKSQKSQDKQMGHEIELKYLICHKQRPSLENMYTSLLSAHCTTSSCQI